MAKVGDIALEYSTCVHSGTSFRRINDGKPSIRLTAVCLGSAGWISGQDGRRLTLSASRQFGSERLNTNSVGLSASPAFLSGLTGKTRTVVCGYVGIRTAGSGKPKIPESPGPWIKGKGNAVCI